MGIDLDNTRPPKRRKREKHNVNVGTGSIYRDLLKEQNGVDFNNFNLLDNDLSHPDIYVDGAMVTQGDNLWTFSPRPTME